MFGFPPILDGNAGIKFTNNADSGFPKPGIREIFYSIRDGNWTDQTVWQTASGRVGLLPSANDDVYVRHTIALNTNTTVNNLFTTIFSVFTVNATFTLGINGQIVNNANTTIINAGTINFLTQRAAETSIFNGTFNITSNVNTIAYTGDYSATMPSTLSTFHNLTISGIGTKTLGVNTTLNGNLSLIGVAGVANSCNLECSSFNLTVNGTTSGTGGCWLGKSGTGNLLFVGAFNFNQLFSRLIFTGNPTVEFRNGFTFAGGSGAASDCGTGLWSFTTNSQNINLNFAGAFTFNNVQIVGAITITLLVNSAPLTINNSIDGTVAGSKFVNASVIIIPSASTIVMNTGTFDITTNVNTVTYTTSGNLTLPYSTYYNLVTYGTGTKTLGSNTTILGTLGVGINGALTNSVFDCSTYNLTVNGTTTLATNGQFLKSGAGSLTFIGQVLLFQNGFLFNLSGGNPTVELRGGISINTGTGTFNSGTGQWSFTTASQAIASTAANLSMTFNCPILVSGANVLTINNNSGTFTVTMLGVLNGDAAGSTLRMGTNTPTLNYQNTVQPMATGVLDTSTNLNTFIYGAGNQDVKGGTPQQYRNLRFSGSGTTKTLQGNIFVQNTYTVDAGVTVNLNGYTKTP